MDNQEGQKNQNKIAKDVSRKAKNKIVKKIGVTISMVLSSIASLIMPLLPVILLVTTIVGAIFDFATEILTAESTPEAITEGFEVEDLSEVVEIREDGKGGYYYDFIYDFDEKLEKINEKLNSTTGVHNLPKDSDFLKKIIQAELVTQYPDLGGEIPEGSDGFQGAIKIKRATPDKEIEEMKNTGVEDEEPLSQNDILDTGEVGKYEDIVKEWEAGRQVVIRASAKIYKQAESELEPGSDTGYWEEVLDETGRVKTIPKGTTVEYTGTYKTNTNALTNEVTTYIEVKYKDENVFIRAAYVKIDEDNEESQEENSNDENTNTENANTETNQAGEETARRTDIAKVSSRAGEEKEKVGGEKDSYIVAIAAGHTSDTGASSGDLKESELTIEVAEKVEELINERFSNIKVVQTGSTSSNRDGVVAEERPQLAKNANADLCIEIHFNSFSDPSANGVEVIYKEGDGISQQLAEILTKTISDAMGLEDRGAGTDVDKCGGNLVIIGNAADTGFPSVVTEGGFLSGNVDAEVIRSGGVDKYAEGIVNGIKEYLEADHNGYTSIGEEEGTKRQGISSVVRNLKYVPQETLDNYIEEGKLDALEVFSLDEQNNLITATWISKDGEITLMKNSSMSLETALSNFIIPYEYFLFFYIDTDYEDFAEDLAEATINDTEIVMALQDNVTTTETTNETKQRTVYDESETISGETTVESSTTKMETCSTSIDITYVETWWVKSYQDNSYSDEILDLKDGEKKIVTIKGEVTESRQSTTTSWTTIESGVIDDGEQYHVEQMSSSDIWSISNRYGTGELTTEGNESKFVKLYNEHKMNGLVRPDYLFMMIEQNERTSKFLDLTKYLIYKATSISYGVIEFDFSQYGIQQLFGVYGFYGNSIEEKVWFALRDAGYSEIVTAAIMGNISQESSFDPTSVNSIGATGLCQWLDSRADGLRAYAMSKGVDITDVDTQIEYLLTELNGGSGPAEGYATAQVNTEKLKSQTTIEGAVDVFCFEFERPGRDEANVPRRVSEAYRYYEMFKGRTKPAGVSQGGIKTEAERAALEKLEASWINTTVHSNYENQSGPFMKYWDFPLNESRKFQCTWWATGRANMYLDQYGTKYRTYYPDRINAEDYGDLNARYGWFQAGMQPRVNSIIYWYGPGPGHVGYVEGVTSEGIYVSEAASGKAWMGIRMIPLNGSAGWSGYSLGGYIYLDLPR